MIWFEGRSNTVALLCFLVWAQLFPYLIRTQVRLKRRFLCPNIAPLCSQSSNVSDFGINRG